MPLNVDIPLIGEMPVRDFALDARVKGETGEEMHERLKVLGKEIGFFSGLTLRPTVDGGYQWAGDDEFEAHKRDLAKFFNSAVKGPYYIHNGYINTRDTLNFVILDRKEADALIERFGEEFKYKINDYNFTLNAEHLAKRNGAIGWVPKDERLLPYLEAALNL